MATADGAALIADGPALIADAGIGRIAAKPAAVASRTIRRGFVIGAILLTTDVVVFVPAMLLVGPVNVRTPIVLVLAIGLFYAAGLYRPRLSLSVLDDTPDIMGRALLAGTGTMLLAGLDDGETGLWRLGTSAVFGGLCLVGRAVAYGGIRLARTRGRLQRRALILGAGTIAGNLAANLLAHPQYGVRPVGMLDDDPLLGEDERVIPVVGRSEDLARVVVDHAVDDVIVTYGSVRDPSVVGILRTCDRLACEIFYVPRLYELQAMTRGTEMLWGVPLVRLRRAPYRSGSWTIKRISDVVIAGLALFILAPILGLAAVLARWETGSVIFHQTRIGLDGKPFTVLKFCSLRPAGESESASRWNIAQDARLGPVGKLLRRTSFDELPQLWNVLRGDMSLVGPRPERPLFVDEFSRQFPWYPARHRVPAGLTGWAQVNGLRGDTSIADRARFDNFYIENWSLWGDVKILLRTFIQVIKAAGR